MGLLKKEKAPDELPELALSAPAETKLVPVAPTPQAQPSPQSTQQVQTQPKTEGANQINPNAEPKPTTAQPLTPTPQPAPVAQSQPKTEEVKAEEKKEPEMPSKTNVNLEDIKSKIAEHKSDNNSETPKFFDQILDDINSGIQDLGKLEDWYKNKFSTQDIVSNMKGYWEGNKADIIIQSFGSEYKKKISENIKNLQVLEEDWRVIYFQLIKKEEEMKAVEQELKSTLAEFVDLCKRRNDEKGTKKEGENN